MLIRSDPPHEPRRVQFGWTRWRNYACMRKRAWGKKANAKAAGRKQMEDGAPQLYVYQCQLCRDWHLTHKNYDGGEPC